MKTTKKILAMLMTLCLCGSIAGCGSSAGNTEGDSAKTEPAAEERKEEEKAETEPEPEEKDTDSTVNIGILAFDTGKAEANEFVTAVQASLSEAYSDQIGEIVVTDTLADASLLPIMLDNYIANWKGEKAAILIVNGENGFSDEALLSALTDAEKAGFVTGVDHTIDGAPESTFVYDASDAAGCALLIMQNTAE